MSTILAYLTSRLAEPTTRAGLLTWLAGTIGAVTAGGDYLTIGLIAVSALGGILCPEAKPVLDAFDTAVTKARASTTAVSCAVLALLLGGGLSACTAADEAAFQSTETVACDVDALTQPIAAAIATAAGAGAAAAVDAPIHAAIQGACQAGAAAAVAPSAIGTQ